jgi:predicted nucleic acid-binding Zn ribbon protein
MTTIDATDARLSTHEEICALRYEKINETLEKGEQRMTKMEYLIYAVLAVVLLGPGVGAEFFKKLLGI